MHCPRCGGRLFPEPLDRGWWFCLSCGAVLTPDFSLPKSPPRGERRAGPSVDFRPRRAARAPEV
jgi:transcription initiation factor TFIIIB Brf1 subunit/transcription initiation factor TFIIB